MTYINQETKGDDPTNEQEEIHRPVNEGARKWKQPEQCKQYRQACNNFGVDEALPIPGALTAGIVEIFASQASNDGGEGELELVSGGSFGQVNKQNLPLQCEETCQQGGQ